ncbi:uncharacterized protein LOC121000947 [Bufo bufo]|uniref:uncharacterized protein LOC121000947 n=1 Tax=Bufo bufo TaxID=8384 RepID=UPI001ABE9AC8|nr:uncharacterized protein LOC121000947 [Bufo bufo]
MEAAGQEPLLFDDVAIYFTQEEWGSLEEWQKDLYKEVMMETYCALRSLGIPMVKSELLLLIESGKEPCIEGAPRWEELGCDPEAASDLQSWRDAEEVSMYDRVWTEHRALTYRRRVVRKRRSRRSPNFSRIELECFVSLMDRYLPDELQRTGAISLRQRRSILQEIARCLEPMSGCLRTPRQLLHRWADFNNRDPERLMEIRMQLHFGRRWKRRLSRPLSSPSSSSEEGEEAQGDPLSSEWDERSRESSAYFPILPDLPVHTSLTTHIDAQGHYIVPPPLRKSGKRWGQRSAGECMEEQSGLHGSSGVVKRFPGRATTAALYSSLHAQGDPAVGVDPEIPDGLADPGLRMIKSEPDSEEDEGGGSWSSDIPSPESVMSGQSDVRKLIERQSTEPLSPALVSPEDSVHLKTPPPGGQPGVKLESSPLSGPCRPESQTSSQQEDPPGTRSSKRSPNFSPAELECFVALMDNFLPDNHIRAGAIPIRQRKAILLEIARRLEPLSGCLRTPRQLRHRWTDFNNRDPDRLEEIRSRLRRAARQDSCKKSMKAAESAPAAGNNWRRRRSYPLQRDIKEEEQNTSEGQIPRTPWHHRGLPKPRNSFSMARLKKNRHLALHIFRMERLLQRVDQQQELLLQTADLSTDEEDCSEQKTSQMHLSI